MNVVELAPYMSPACGFDDPAAFVEMVEPSIGVGLQNTGEGTQVLPGMFSLAILRIGEPHSWRHITARWTVIADIGPESRGFGLACSWSQHRNGRVIGVYLRSRKYMLAQLIDQ